MPKHDNLYRKLENYWKANMDRLVKKLAWKKIHIFMKKKEVIIYRRKRKTANKSAGQVSAMRKLRFYRNWAKFYVFIVQFNLVD